MAGSNKIGVLALIAGIFYFCKILAVEYDTFTMNRKLVFVTKTSLSFNASEKWCELMGGSLPAPISNSTDEDLILEVMLRISSKPVSFNGYWIGVRLNENRELIDSDQFDELGLYTVCMLPSLNQTYICYNEDGKVDDHIHGLCWVDLPAEYEECSVSVKNGEMSIKACVECLNERCKYLISCDDVIKYYRQKSRGKAIRIKCLQK